MPTKPVFSPVQLDVIRAAAKRVYEKRFAWMRKTAEHPGGQEAMALALDIAQQSVSNLLKGTYNPGWKVAKNIANLDGQTLEQLLAHVEEESAPQLPSVAKLHVLPAAEKVMRNLERVLDYHEDDKRWSSWTIAVARLGYFGTDDYSKGDWETRLDALEKLLANGRKAG